MGLDLGFGITGSSRSPLSSHSISVTLVAIVVVVVVVVVVGTKRLWNHNVRPKSRMGGLDANGQEVCYSVAYLSSLP